MSRPSAILMGSKPGAVVALETMISRGWSIRGVIVEKANDYSWIAGETLEQAASRLGLPVTTQAELERAPVEFVISYMYRKRVKPDVIRTATRAAVNFHPAPLPEFGGWAFYNVALLEKATEYGCTCHHMDEGFDSGPLLQVNKFPIDSIQETAYSLERKTQQEMIRLFLSFCQLAESDRPLPQIPQDPSKMRYMNREEFESLKQVPAGATAEEMQRYARAFWYPPYQCAYIEINGVRGEIIPELAKKEAATRLHHDDLDNLRTIAECSVI